MKEQISIKSIFIVIFVLLISSCTSKKTNDFDLSDIKRPIKKELKKEEKNISKTKPEVSIKYELKNLKEREDILSSTKFGKDDPFTLSSYSSSTLSKLKLKGFITISKKNYAIVKYLDNEGPIFVESIGGKNTNLLPEGALITEINPIEEYIKMSHEGEIFILFYKK